MTVNVTDIPVYLADRLSIPEFGAEILVTTIILFAFLMPIIILKVRGAGWLAELGISFLVLGFSIALQWLPTWFLLMLSFIVALLFASNARKWVTGKG